MAYHIIAVLLFLPFFIESAAYADNLFGTGTGPIVYSDVQCVGHEQNIAQCPKNTYPEISCPSGVAAGVMCADGESVNDHNYIQYMYNCLILIDIILLKF